MHKLNIQKGSARKNKSRPVWVGFLPFVVFLFLSHPGWGEEKAIEVIDHSWKTTEKWERINKTRYSWEATVKSHAPEQRRVSVYYYLLDEGGRPLAMNTMIQIMKPDETVHVVGDSYVENGKLPFIKGSTVKVNSRRFP
ncbi:MAG TPA: hypothetical protein VGB26_15580 [Nitrospiria bacterium]|jgi:hypothetical protein